MATEQSSGTDGRAGSPAGRPATLRVIALFLLVAALFVTLHVLGTGTETGDIDDRLRAVQITQLFQGKGWYDLVLDGIAMPEPYVSPWSRLIDAPYVVLAHLLSLFQPAAQALHTAFLLWPPVLLVIFAALAGPAMMRLVPAEQPVRLLAVALAALIMSRSFLEFMPGRIDHHGMQLVALMAMALGAVLWSARGGVLMAAAVVLSVTVGLECLPIIAALWAALALAWVARQPGADRVFTAFSVALALLAPLVTLAIAGPRVFFAVETDIFSAPYVTLFTIFALSSAVLTRALRQAGSLVRLAMLAVAAIAAILIVVAVMPAVLAGPYGIIDPVSRSLWLERIPQENSVLLLLIGAASRSSSRWRSRER